MPSPKTKPKEPKRRKAVRKDETIPIRCTPEQKAALVQAADRVGMGVSTWLLSLGLRETQKTGG